MLKPKILILDEAKRAALTSVPRRRFTDSCVNSPAREWQVLMISSEMPEVLGMSDRVMVMHEGRMTGILDRADADQVRIMQLASQ